MAEPVNEIPAYMGTREEAHAKLMEKALAWRDLCQPSIDTRAGHNARDVREREARFQLANAALLWLWFEENQPAPSTDKLVEALRDLTAACEDAFTSPATEDEEFRDGDDESVFAGSNHKDSLLTFGVIRRARRVLNEMGDG